MTCARTVEIQKLLSQVIMTTIMNEVGSSNSNDGDGSGSGNGNGNGNSNGNSNGNLIIYSTN